MTEYSTMAALRLLGRPRVVLAGQVHTDLPDKAFVLLALLDLEFGGVASRDQVRTLLWENASREKAAANLRWLLKKIRDWEKRHGFSLLDADSTDVVLPPDVATDIAGLVTTREITSAEALEAFVSTCGGELLAGLDAGLDPQLLETTRHHRQRLRERYVSLCRRAAAAAGGETGERILRHLLELAPDDEELVRTLLAQVYRLRGDRAVETEYQELVRRLGDYGSVPSLETAALAAQLAPATASTPRPGGGEVVQDGIPTVMVLPPEIPLAVDPRAVTIAEALVDDVCLQLCRMRTFAVFAPHTSHQIAGRNASMTSAGYGARYVGATRLLPSVNGGLRLSLSLLSTATNAIAFADQFAFDEAMLGTRFAEIAEAIAGAVSGAIERIEIGASRRNGGASAYVSYLLGTRDLDVQDLPSLRRARHHFEEALALTPNYLPALTGIARTLSKEALVLRRSDRELAERALRIADRAAEIDPLDPAGWREKALASLYCHDIDASLEHIDAALSRAPHHADILAEKADILSHAARQGEAKAHMIEALKLNPLPPDDYYWTLGSAEFFLGRYGEAVETLFRMRNTDGASRMIAAAAAMAEDPTTAAAYRDRWLSIYPDSRIADVGGFTPHADQTDLRHFCDALRRAGFPE